MHVPVLNIFPSRVLGSGKRPNDQRTQPAIFRPPNSTLGGVVASTVVLGSRSRVCERGAHIIHFESHGLG